MKNTTFGDLPRDVRVQLLNGTGQAANSNPVKAAADEIAKSTAIHPFKF